MSGGRAAGPAGQSIIRAAEICGALDLSVFHPGNGAREIRGVVVGDLLSRVLAEARPDWLWVTIHVHLNVAAVAVLKELPMVIIASGRAPQDDLLEKCAEENITLANTPLSAYEICCALCRLNVGMKAGEPEGGRL